MQYFRSHHSHVYEVQSLYEYRKRSPVVLLSCTVVVFYNTFKISSEYHRRAGRSYQVYDYVVIKCLPIQPLLCAVGVINTYYQYAAERSRNSSSQWKALDF